ncbi:uncharacterized protein LOC133896386 [Phragmites australis]|uniref:uncharacterized protein LOC133896386 n=1 Tax=Phragmites australis TaxID=29695 RepID=UPI002D7A296A|nr:uncharacterized protein LOC133896386 [Phragmites australis]
MGPPPPSSSQWRGLLRRPRGGRRGGHAPRGAPQLRRQRLLFGRRRRGRAAPAAPPGRVLRGRPAAARGVPELGAGHARVDQAGQRPPRHPRHPHWDNHAYCVDWPSDLHVLPAGCDCQCRRRFCPDVIGSCRRILGYLLCLLSCSVYWGSINCYIHHLCHGYLSNCWSDDCYWLGWVLLDDLVGCKEKHGPDEALHRHDKFGVLIVLPACEPEACGLKLVSIRWTTCTKLDLCELYELSYFGLR